MISELNLKKRLTMRGYQETVVTDIVNKFELDTPYVLGSCPGSGKTEMSIEVMIRLMEIGLVNRVLILAHSTNVLKENFYERLCEYFNEEDIEVMRGQKDYSYDARIQVMIPQNIKHVLGDFDLIITDEAQHNVLADGGNYSRIIEMVKPKFQLLLTGTPSKFVLENNLATTDNLELPYHINTVGMDMVGFDFFHNVRFDLIKSAYGFTNEDYNQDKNLLTDINFSFDETERTINNVIIGVVRNIALRNGIELPKDSDFVLEGRKLIQEGNFGKTLIMCRSIEQAKQISKIISKLFEVKVRVSDSKDDASSSNLDKFKKNQFEFLCVVNRAREGYDDKKVVNLIDITLTHNIDLIYQMFCRVVRKDDMNHKPKLYVKVTSNAEGMPEYTMNIMTAALMLGATKNLSAFNGRNFRGLVMPMVERDETEEDDVVVDGFIDVVDNNGNVVRRRQINDLMALDLIQMFTEDNENLIKGQDRYAMTTLGESLKLLSGDGFYEDKEGYFELIKQEGLSNKSWGENYKILSERDNMNYHSTPWTYFNQTMKEFFDECFPERVFYDYKEGYFQLFREEGIKHSGIWGEKYINLKEKYNINYSANPWKLYNQTETEFFSECYPERLIFYLNKEGYIKLFIENNIKSGHKWINSYKNITIENGFKYHSTPWKLFNQTEKEFLDECFPQDIIFNDKEGYFKLMNEENITNLNQWVQNYKRLKEKNNIRYHSEPWFLFNLSQTEFFNEMNNYLGIECDILTSDEVFNICVDNLLITTTKYKKYRSENEDINLPSHCWDKSNKKAGEYFSDVRKAIEDKTNKIIDYRPAYLGEFSEMNKTWNITNSKNNHKRLNKDKTEWFKYHELYSNSRKKWNEIPYIELSKKIKDRPDWIIGDFGCGENLLSKEIKNKVHSFDHVAIDDTVQSCDLTDVPLHNNVLDVVVFSLSLMGTNYKEYFDEAYRVLRPMGVIFIAEPATRWEDREDELKVMLESSGFKVTGDVKHSDRFIYVDAIKY